MPVIDIQRTAKKTKTKLDSTSAMIKSFDNVQN